MEGEREDQDINALADFLAALRMARTEAGISTVEAARRAGFKQPDWVRLESGRAKNPTVKTLETAARAIDKRLVIALVDGGEPGEATAKS